MRLFRRVDKPAEPDWAALADPRTYEWPEEPETEPLPKIVLPALPEPPLCPKCRSSDLEMAYQPRNHSEPFNVTNCPIRIDLDPEYYRDLYSMRLAIPWEEKIEIVARRARNERRIDTIPEHLDLRCLICNYVWASAPAEE